MRKVTFYHAGCPVCVTAEQEILNLIDTNNISVDRVHLGEQKDRIPDAELAGVQSVPALVLDNRAVLHINYGASLEAVKS